MERRSRQRQTLIVGLAAAVLQAAAAWAGGDCGGEPCPSAPEKAAAGAPMSAPAPPPQQQPARSPAATPAPSSSVGPQAAGGSTQNIPLSVYKEAMSAERRAQTKEATPAMASEPEVLYPEKTVFVTLSATDSNRFVCTTGEVGDMISDTAKGLITEYGGNEGWAKFQIEKNPLDGKLVFASVDTDIFIKCGGETYSVIGKPKVGLPARTFYMVSPSKSQAKEAQRMSALDLDKAVAYIAQKVFMDDVPPHWEEIKSGEFRRYRVAGVLVDPVIAWKIPGVDVIVKLLTLRIDKGPVRIEEADLLFPSLVVNPVGISIRNHNLDSDRPTTPAIIIERLERRRDG